MLLHLQIRFRKTHNIGALLDLLPRDIEAPPSVEQAALLTRYAVDTRYPGAHEFPTWKACTQAIYLAQEVITWVKSILHEKEAR